jgi:hypothetical protein
VAKQFTYTGAVATYVVPDGVTTATAQVIGGSGADNLAGVTVYSEGGKGVSITGDVVVAPGDVFTVGVGGRGGENDANPGFGGWGSTAQYTGGTGGTGYGNGATNGSGGGGASTLALNGTLIVVAAGGGGGAGPGSFAGLANDGGDGGDVSGKDGVRSPSDTSGGRGGSAALPALDRTGGSETGTQTAGGGGGGGAGVFAGEGGISSLLAGGGGGGGSSLHTVSSPVVATGLYGPGVVVLTLKGPAPTISGTPPQQEVGRPYSYAFDVGGSAATTVTAGSLPPGLVLSTSGVVSGTPTAAGTSTFTVTATNTLTSTSLATEITILPAPAPSPTSPSVTTTVSGSPTTPTATFSTSTSADVSPTSSGTTAPAPGLGGQLAATGATSVIPTVVIAGLLVLIGSGLVSVAWVAGPRRRRSPPSPR